MRRLVPLLAAVVACLLAAVVACLLAAAPAAATTMARVSHGYAQKPTTRPYQLPIRPQAPAVAFAAATAEDCGGEVASGLAVACYDPQTNTVYLGSEAGEWTRQHEMGHAADALYLSDEERSSFLKLMPVIGDIEPDAGWWGYDEPTPDGPDLMIFGGAEIFADAYASCRLRLLPQPRPNRHGVIVGSWPSNYGYHPDTNNRQRRVCARIARWVTN